MRKLFIGSVIVTLCCIAMIPLTRRFIPDVKVSIRDVYMFISALIATISGILTVIAFFMHREEITGDTYVGPRIYGRK
jgi:hypothetical protein